MKSRGSLGYLYVATGNTFIEEAERSAQSLLKLQPGAEICLVCDQPYAGNIFHNVVQHRLVCQEGHKKYGYLYKISGLLQSPFDKTLYIDTDTYFTDNCAELFTLLNYFDLMICHDYMETSFAIVDNQQIDGYHTYNTGVIPFNASKNINSFIENWFTIFERKIDEYWSDQPAFMEALLTSKIKSYSLQTNYNFRFKQFLTVSTGKVKILHGRHPDIELLANKLNHELNHRAWDPKMWTLRSWKKNSLFNLLKRIFKAL